MSTFGQLLNDHIKRLGISDTELARTVGVSRQTVFRWREGLTSRPRRREDVLATAQKLRLTPEERDTLLLAAGFRPEDTAPPGDTGAEVKTEKRPPVTRYKRPFRWFIVAGAGGLIMIMLLIWLASGRQIAPPAKATASPTTDSGMATQPVTSATSTATIASAAPGEALVWVAQSANSQPGDKFTERLVDALQREISGNRLSNIRLATPGATVDTLEQALQLGRETGATLVIYGECDTGQVRVQLAHPLDQGLATGHPPLTISVNSNRPLEIRSLALLALGQLYLNQNNVEQALELLAQAHNTLQDNAHADEQTWAVVDALLCRGYAIKEQPEQALPYCQQAVAADPQPAFFEGRGLAYALLGDYPAAVADFRTYAAWLEEQSGDSGQERLTRLQSWIEMLEAGQNPFTPSVLSELGDEFGR